MHHTSNYRNKARFLYIKYKGCKHPYFWVRCLWESKFSIFNLSSELLGYVWTLEWGSTRNQYQHWWGGRFLIPRMDCCWWRFSPLEAYIQQGHYAGQGGIGLRHWWGGGGGGGSGTGESVCPRAAQLTQQIEGSQDTEGICTVRCLGKTWDCCERIAWVRTVFILNGQVIIICCYKIILRKAYGGQLLPVWAPSSPYWSQQV